MSEMSLAAKSLNDSLWDLYDAVTEKTYGAIKAKNRELPDTEKAANPLFIAVPEDYVRADVRLMVFGQETNGYGTYGDDEEKFLVDNWLWEDEECYNSFFGEKRCYGYPGPFWSVVKKFITELQEKNTGKQISYLYNNVLKMGLAEKNNPGTTPYWYENIIKPHLNKLIVQEIGILKPDFLVFFCGPEYDRYLNDIFDNPVKKPVAGFGERELCEFVIPNVKKAFRTYHPNFLFRNNPDRPYTDFVDALVGDLSEDMKKSNRKG